MSCATLLLNSSLNPSNRHQAKSGHTAVLTMSAFKSPIRWRDKQVTRNQLQAARGLEMLSLTKVGLMRKDKLKPSGIWEEWSHRCLRLPHKNPSGNQTRVRESVLHPLQLRLMVYSASCTLFE